MNPHFGDTPMQQARSLATNAQTLPKLKITWCLHSHAMTAANWRETQYSTRGIDVRGVFPTKEGKCLWLYTQAQEQEGDQPQLPAMTRVLMLWIFRHFSAGNLSCSFENCLADAECNFSKCDSKVHFYLKTNNISMRLLVSITVTGLCKTLKAHLYILLLNHRIRQLCLFLLS